LIKKISKPTKSSKNYTQAYNGIVGHKLGIKLMNLLKNALKPPYGNLSNFPMLELLLVPKQLI